MSEVPYPARRAWTALRDELRSILGDELVAMWAYGGTTSVADPVHAADLDTYVVISGRPDAPTVLRIEDAEERIAREHGVVWDNQYIGVDEASSTDFVRHAWRPERRDTSWSLNRSHWLAGRYVLLHGPAPEAIIQRPTWDEIQVDLSRELEHLERHVIAGDTDPYEATYAILNGSRILRGLSTRAIGVSKREAGIWGLEHLPPRWHPALQSALRAYAGEATDDDRQVLAAEMEPFVAFVREQLPHSDDRPPDAVPRRSGS